MAKTRVSALQRGERRVLRCDFRSVVELESTRLHALCSFLPKAIARVELFRKRHRRILAVRIRGEVVRPEAERALRRRGHRAGRHVGQERHRDFRVPIHGAALLREIQTEQISRIRVPVPRGAGVPERASLHGCHQGGYYQKFFHVSAATATCSDGRAVRSSSSEKRTITETSEITVTIAPRINSACVHGMLPLKRKLASTEPTLPPAPTIPATAPRAFRLTKGTSA